ncbi:hypothetical protein NIES2111_29530 [Nostoc sp. NIES-2111]|nr:hypothetical protein NIES2111_29530 [Nostoc sp. NIES-2111]
MILHRSTKSGYLAAIIGSLIGAIALIFLGAYLGGLYAKYFMPNASLDGLLPPIFGSFIGWWVGEVLGCWLALHWLGYRKAKKTAIHLAMITPCGIITWLVFSIQVSTRIENYYPDFQRYLMPLSVSFTTIILAWLARFNTKPLSPRQNN